MAAKLHPLQIRRTTEMTDHAPETLQAAEPAPRGSVHRMVLQPYYQDNYCKIYCGDARHLIPQLQTPDAVLTDPVWPNCTVPLHGQNDPEGMLAEMWESFRELPKRCAIHLGCDSDPRFLRAVPATLPFFRVAWLKLARVGYKGRLLMTGDVAYLFGEPPASRKGAHVIPGECMDADGKGKQSEHPCPRKLKHVSWLVNWWTEETDLILDPFMGSGTTLLAAKLSNRQSIGIEIDERFCEMAAARLTQEPLRLENIVLDDKP
jgi:site-specific DNA-methyltransferase (adenine-specific)